MCILNTGVPSSADLSGYLSDQTIFSLSSALGGPIAVFRISGTGVRSFIVSALKSAGGRSVHLDERVATFVRIVRSNDARVDDVKTDQGALGRDELIDEAVATYFFGPKSFTGEDVLELAIHGAPSVASALTDLCYSLGFRQALPGEFSFRAVKNGKMDYVQASAIHDLVVSESDEQRSTALATLGGGMSSALAELRQSLLDLATLAELGIDFSDQDVEEVSLPALKSRVLLISNTLKKLSETYSRGRQLMDGVPISIIGLPNAGKSSLFNALLGENRSIVTDIQGTTRDVIRETLLLRDKNGSSRLFRFSDTAGLRQETPDTIEKEGILRSVAAAKESEVILLVVDSLMARDLLLGGADEANATWNSLLSQVSFLRDTGKKFLGVLAKSDLLVAGESNEGLSLERWTQFTMASGFDSKTTWLKTSVKNDEESIQRLVNEVCSAAPLVLGGGDLVLTKIEQKQAVLSAATVLEEVLLLNDQALFASGIRRAMNELNPLLGQVVTDEILSQIFSQFCIGK